MKTIDDYNILERDKINKEKTSKVGINGYPALRMVGNYSSAKNINRNPKKHWELNKLNNFEIQNKSR